MAMWSPYQKYPATIQAVLANGNFKFVKIKQFNSAKNIFFDLFFAACITINVNIYVVNLL